MSMVMDFLAAMALVVVLVVGVLVAKSLAVVVVPIVVGFFVK